MSLTLADAGLERTDLARGDSHPATKSPSIQTGRQVTNALAGTRYQRPSDCKKSTPCTANNQATEVVISCAPSSPG